MATSESTATPRPANDAILEREREEMSPTRFVGGGKIAGFRRNLSRLGGKFKFVLKSRVDDCIVDGGRAAEKLRMENGWSQM